MIVKILASAYTSEFKLQLCYFCQCWIG